MQYEFAGFHSSKAEDYVLVESDAASLGSWILMLHGSIVSSPSSVSICPRRHRSISQKNGLIDQLSVVNNVVQMQKTATQ
jgi:hypothetical protein